jgi:hypothetical protein
MARSTTTAGSPNRLVGYLLAIGGIALAALSVQVAMDDLRLRGSTVVLADWASIWSWLRAPVIVGGIGLVMLLVGWIMAARVHSAIRLLRAGDAGRARVVETVQAGKIVNEQTPVRVTMLVDLPGHPTYAATTRTTLSTVALGQVQPGAIVAVRVDPRDPQRVAIDWAGARQAGG